MGLTERWNRAVASFKDPRQVEPEVLGADDFDDEDEVEAEIYEPEGAYAVFFKPLPKPFGMGRVDNMQEAWVYRSNDGRRGTFLTAADTPEEAMRTVAGDQPEMGEWRVVNFTTGEWSIFVVEVMIRVSPTGQLPGATPSGREALIGHRVG